VGSTKFNQTVSLVIKTRQKRDKCVTSLFVGVGSPYRYWLHLVPHDHPQRLDHESSSMDAEACREAGWELVSSRVDQDGDEVLVFRSALAPSGTSAPNEAGAVPQSGGEGSTSDARRPEAGSESLALRVSQPESIGELLTSRPANDVGGSNRRAVVGGQPHGG